MLDVSAAAQKKQWNGVGKVNNNIITRNHSSRRVFYLTISVLVDGDSEWASLNEGPQNVHLGISRNCALRQKAVLSPMGLLAPWKVVCRTQKTGYYHFRTYLPAIFCYGKGIIEILNMYTATVHLDCCLQVPHVPGAVPGTSQPVLNRERPSMIYNHIIPNCFSPLKLIKTFTLCEPAMITPTNSYSVGNMLAYKNLKIIIRN